MPLAICGVQEVPAFATIPLDHIISIRDSRQVAPDIRAFKTEFTLHSFVFDDTGDATNPLAITSRTMERLLSIYAQTTPAQNILFHCFAGVSRSSAAAFVWLVHHGMSYAEAYQLLVTIRGPFICPNQLMIKLADQIMGKNGEMEAFMSAETGRRASERQQYFDSAR
jgi:predicted protein tyrosine phosphatase